MDKHMIKLLMASLVLFGMVAVPMTVSAQGPGHGAAKARAAKNKPIKRGKAGLKAEELRERRAIREKAKDARIEAHKLRHNIKHDALKARVKAKKAKVADLRDERRDKIKEHKKTCADPRYVRKLNKKVRFENHKHLRRLAKLDRLAEIARETMDTKLLGRVGMLREKELSRHERVERRLLHPRCLKAPAPKPSIEMPKPDLVIPKELHLRR